MALHDQPDAHAWLQGQQARLETLLDERSRLRAWTAADAPADLRALAERSLARLDRDLSDLLTRWHRAGGGLRLVAPSMPTPSTPHGDEGAPGRHRTLTPAPPPRQESRPDSATPTGPPRTHSPRASRDSVEALAERARRGELNESPTPDPDWRGEFGRMMRHLPPAADLDAERRKVMAAATACDRWTGWPRHVQRHLVGWLACRLRALQDEHDVPEEMLQDGFSALTRFSKRAQPGFVFGLSRSHLPQHGESWDDDAERHWDQLAALLPDDQDPPPNAEKALEHLDFLMSELADPPSAEIGEVVLAQAVRATSEVLEAGVDSRDPRLVRLATPLHDDLEGRHFRRLRRAIRDARAPEADPDDAPTPDLPEDWAWWHWTRGRKAVMVGGVPREHARERLERAFAFEELTWVSTEHARRGLQNLAERVRGGSADMLIMLGRFIGHDADRILLPAARDAGTAWVHVDHGYGVNRVRYAIERFLEPEGQPSL